MRLVVTPLLSVEPGLGSGGQMLLAKQNRTLTTTLDHSTFSSGMQRVYQKKISLTERLHGDKIDVACIQETHLNSNHRFTIRGYQTFRMDREGRHKGGNLGHLFVWFLKVLVNY